LSALEKSLKADEHRSSPTKEVWREAWESLLTAQKIWLDENERPPDYGVLMKPVIDWLCTKGLQNQIVGWLGKPAARANALADQLSRTRPRKADAQDVPTIAEAASTLIKVLLDKQSTSTRAVLKNIAKGTTGFGGESDFPGRLEEGLRVMGSWEHDGLSEPLPKTLYAGKPDIVLAVFNSPFGPDVLVATDRLSEGVDLHRFCRHLIHYELDPSPLRTLQRNGRVRRIESWAALTKKPIRYAYPTFDRTRDERAVDIIRRRITVFDLLLGGVPVLDDEPDENNERFADQVLKQAHKKLKSLNRKLRV